MESIVVKGFWNDDKTEFEHSAVIGIDVSNEEDDDIFYYFENESEIIGEHTDFTITEYKKEA